MRKVRVFSVFSILSLAGIPNLLLTISMTTALTFGVTNVSFAQDAPKTRRVPTLRARVYEQLARAQTESEAGNVEDAIGILDDVKAKIGSMNAYEIATMYNFYGFIYYEQENFPKTIESFERAIEQTPIPIGFEQTALYSLAQLNMVEGDYKKVIDYLERWEALATGDIPPRNMILKAQAFYQDKQFAEAGYLIEKAIAAHEAEGYLPDENWLILQRAIYFELKQPVKVKDTIAKLIRLYDTPTYWIQLAGMYGELEENEKQLATMEIAYQRGYVTSGSDIFMLSQLYYFNGIPYKGARLMEEGLSSGVLEENLRNTQFLAQSWQAAREDNKAINAFEIAADLSEDGELDAQLALLYYNNDKFDKAIEASNRAIDKGELRNPGNTYMVLGLALYNKRQFADAITTLAKAEEFAPSRASARQWRGFVEREKTTYEARVALEAAG
ncbi:MAG: tetratricopeptide repeat protein [Pseudomonadota bacterium]